MAQIHKAFDSNWEAIAFALIYGLVGPRYPRFRRTELFRQANIDSAVSLLEALGHKKNPQHPEEALQRTIQNMRDKEFIDFLGDGNYQLTTKGREAMEACLSSPNGKIITVTLGYQKIKF